MVHQQYLTFWGNNCLSENSCHKQIIESKTKLYTKCIIIKNYIFLPEIRYRIMDTNMKQVRLCEVMLGYVTYFE